MTRILALDTSSGWGGVAVVERERPGAPIRVVAEAGFQARDHARHLVGWIDALLTQAGLDRVEIDAFVATRGPGSFAGIRVGMGTIRGLAVASGKPCYGVCTLEAMAEAFGPAEAIRVPWLAAGRGEVFGAAFDAASSPPRERTAPMVGPPEQVFEASVQDEPAVVFGFGLEAVAQLRPVPGVRVGQPPRGIAAAAARLALLVERGPDSISPVYLRPPDAQPPR